MITATYNQLVTAYLDARDAEEVARMTAEADRTDVNYQKWIEAQDKLMTCQNALRAQIKAETQS